MHVRMWKDDDIIQVNEPGGRKYARGNVAYPSVTTVLSGVEDKSFLKSWKKRVGVDEAERIRNDAATHGTNVHTALENFLMSQHDHLITQAHPHLQSLSDEARSQAIAQIRDGLTLSDAQYRLIAPFTPILPYIQPVALEKRVIWNDEANPHLGFGGTADAYNLIDSRLFPPNTKPLFGDGEKGYTLAICDWKNFSKRKTALAYNRGGRPYFPLVRYALQLSAYAAAFNRLTDRKYPLNNGLLVCAYKVEREDDEVEYGLDLIYFNPRAMCWFWNKFKTMLNAHYNQEKYDWKKFCREAHQAGVLGQCLLGNLADLDAAV